MSHDFMNTKEVAQYLGIHEKQVYALIRAGKLPATRITGKWLFPRQVLEEWIESQARSALQEVREKTKEVSGALLAAGSNDPALDMLLTFLGNRRNTFIFTSTVGSVWGLKTLGEGKTEVAWCHIYDPQSAGYNTPALVKPYLGDMPYVVIRLFTREIGLLLPKGNPVGIRGLPDVLNGDVRWVNRQVGSGIRIFFDNYVKKAGANPQDIPGYGEEVYTHLEVGLKILSGQAQVGLATVAIGRMLELDAIPIMEEPFEMIVPKASFFTTGVQAIIETLNSHSFREKVALLGGYNFTEAGRISYAGV